MKYFNSFLIIALSSIIFLSSCEKKEVEKPNTHDDAWADVFVKKVKSPQGDKYGLVFYTAGEGLTACKVTAPDGTKYELAEFWKGAGNMRLHPTNTDMKATMPETGEYTFTLTFDDGETKTLTDELENVEIPAITGVTAEHTAGTNAVTANWNAVTDVDNYMVKLTDEFKNKNKPLFNNKTLTKNDVTYSFDENTTTSPGWMGSVPDAGDVCYVMVVGIKYETGVSGSEKNQNKQMNTVKPVMITW